MNNLLVVVPYKLWGYYSRCVESCESCQEKLELSELIKVLPGLASSPGSLGGGEKRAWG